MGLTKKDSQAYTLIAQTVNVPPEKIVFVDDDLTNIQAAQSARFQTLLFQGNHTVTSSALLQF